MNRMIQYVLSILFLFGCNVASKSVDNVESKNQSLSNKHISGTDFRHLKKRVNSKKFLERHILSKLNTMIKLVDSQSYPKEIYGFYSIFKTIKNDKTTKEFKGDVPLLCLHRNGGSSIGTGSRLLDIKIIYLKYVTALMCVSDNQSPAVLWLFADNKFIVSFEDEMMFMKKSKTQFFQIK